MAERKKKVDKAHGLPISRQCLTLDISRSSAYRKPAGANADDIDLMRKLNELHVRRPFEGSRQLRDDLWDNHGLHVNRKREVDPCLWASRPCCPVQAKACEN